MVTNNVVNLISMLNYSLQKRNISAFIDVSYFIYFFESRTRFNRLENRG